MKEINIAKSGIVLFLVSIITVFVIAGVNYFARPQIIAAAAAARVAALGQVLPDVVDSSFSQEVITGQNNGVIAHFVGFAYGEPVGVVVEINIPGFNPDLNMVVGIGLDGAVVGMEVIGHRETPGFGDFLTEEWFSALFRGMTYGIEVTRSQPGSNQIQVVSRATVSTEAAVSGMNMALAHVRDVVLPNISQYVPEGGN
ncbi:MAG: FMN-binding protein [Defluviitaleaceae bacterium]|nr:FMN-binding protein [Defluviitaleaceae bacterium]